MQQVHATETLSNGMTVMYTDMGVIYLANGRQFEACGEYDSGEAWIDGEHYCYERDDEEVLLTDVRTGEVVYTFEDTDEGWANFAQQQLSK